MQIAERVGQEGKPSETSKDGRCVGVFWSFPVEIEMSQPFLHHSHVTLTAFHMGVLEVEEPRLCISAIEATASKSM